MTALLLGLLACIAAPPPVLPCDDCALTDANNFAWSSTLDAPAWHLASGADATIAWDTLDRDFYGDPFDPAQDVGRVALVALPGLTPEDVADALAHDDLAQADVGLFVFCAPGGATTCRLSDFELFGNGMAVETYFVAGTGTWLLALLTPEDTIGAVAFLIPDAASTTTSVALTPDDSTLALDVDFRSLAPLAVRADEAFHVDWSGLTHDGLGNDLSLGTLDRLVVGRFDAPLSEVETRAHALTESADALWTLDVTGSEAELASLTGETPFTGIDGDATWLLALYCSSCLNPAPRFATVLVTAEDPT
jgi:hypothetical protein